MRGIYSLILISIHIGIKDLFDNKLQSFVTMLGTILGTFSLVAILILSSGLNTYLDKYLNRYGNHIVVKSEGDVVKDFNYNDGNTIENNVSEVESFVPKLWMKSKISFHKKEYEYYIVGTNITGYEMFLQDMIIVKGSNLEKADFSKGALHAVLSRKVASDLNITVGNYMRVDKYYVKIIGLFTNENESSLVDRPHIVLPELALRKYWRGFNPSLSMLEFKMDHWSDIKSKTKTLASELTKVRKGNSDFTIETSLWLDKMKETFQSINITVFLLSILSIMIGGLNLMNLSLSKLEGRIRDVGVYKALGGSNKDLFIMNIAESLFLNIVGGVIGYVLGLTPLLFANEIKTLTSGVLYPEFHFYHSIIAFAIIIIVGVGCSLYPSVKASRMGVSEALRYF